MHLLNNSVIITLISTITFPFALQAEELEITSSNIFIAGSTNVGNWDCMQTSAEGHLNMNGDAIEHLLVKMPVEEFDNCDAPSIGPNSGQRDAVHNYLEAEDHPIITFDLNRTQPENIGDHAQFFGDLTVAGVTNEIREDVEIERNDDQIVVKGSTELKMTDFDIDPPSGLWGAIQARDEVEVEYEFTFE